MLLLTFATDNFSRTCFISKFKNLRAVNGQLSATNPEACQRLNLLEDDANWNNTLTDAVISAHPNKIRTLFSIVISTCFPSNSLRLWKIYQDYITEDILRLIRCSTSNQELLLTLEMYNEALVMIEDMCLAIANKSLAQIGMMTHDR